MQGKNGRINNHLGARMSVILASPLIARIERRIDGTVLIVINLLELMGDGCVYMYMYRDDSWHELLTMGCKHSNRWHSQQLVSSRINFHS
jgi:hypothetical protein